MNDSLIAGPPAWRREVARYEEPDTLRSRGQADFSGAAGG